MVKTFSWKDIEPASFPMRNLPEFDAIIHLAGKAHDTKNRSAAQAYFDINMGLTQKIFDFFLESSAKKFVFFSSVKAAADSVVGDMLTEDVVPAPVGPYGESKIAAENYILDKLKVENGKLKANPYDDKQVYILRPCMIHGSGTCNEESFHYSINLFISSTQRLYTFSVLYRLYQSEVSAIHSLALSLGFHPKRVFALLILSINSIAS